MLEYDYLLGYELNEQLIIKKSDIGKKKSFITDVSDIYPDINLSGGISYLRGNVPLKLLLLLYDKIVIFMPPANKSYFESKYDIDFEDFLTLCRKGIIIPLIGHPTDYCNDYFRELLDLSPPSVWARGISLMNSFDMDFDNAQQVLPVKRIAAFTSVRKQWRKHYPNATEEELTKKIVRELSTLYADLIVFGYGDIVNNLLEQKLPDIKIVYYLKTLNELLTYPYLFGIGGVPVFDFNTTKEKFTTSLSVQNHKIKPDIICPSLKYILEDFDIYFHDLTIKQIIEYHDDNYTVKMRTAINELQKSSKSVFMNTDISTNDIYESAEQVNQVLLDFHKQVGTEISRTIRNARRDTNNVVNLGGLTLGNMLVENSEGNNINISDICQLQSFSTQLLLPSAMEKILGDSMKQQRFLPSVATLWEIQKNINKR